MLTIEKIQEIKGSLGLFSFRGGFAEALITIIAFEEKPNRITITVVSAVFNTALFLCEIYQTDTANNTIIIRLNITDSDNSHIPLRKNAANDKTAVFFRFEPPRVDLIARTKNI